MAEEIGITMTLHDKVSPTRSSKKIPRRGRGKGYLRSIRTKAMIIERTPA